MKAADLHAVEEAADRAFASATIAGLPRWAAEAAADSARVVASAAIGPEALAEVRAAQAATFDYSKIELHAAARFFEETTWA